MASASRYASVVVGGGRGGGVDGGVPGGASGEGGGGVEGGGGGGAEGGGVDGGQEGGCGGAGGAEGGKGGKMQSMLAAQTVERLTGKGHAKLLPTHVGHGGGGGAEALADAPLAACCPAAETCRLHPVGVSRPSCVGSEPCVRASAHPHTTRATECGSGLGEGMRAEGL